MTAPSGYITLDVIDDSDALTKLLQMRQLGGDGIDYMAQMFRAPAGIRGDELTTGIEINPQSSVRWDCTASVQESCAFGWKGADLAWGSERVLMYSLAKSDMFNQLQGYPIGMWLRFPLGQYILTSPGYDDLDTNDIRSVTGYGLNYLLQTAPSDSYAFNAGTTYLNAIQTLFRAAGIVASAGVLSDMCDYSGDWAAKILAQPVNYPMGQAQYYLDIVNDLLASSGQMPIWVQPFTGRWRIDPIVDPKATAIRWTFAGSVDPDVTTIDLKNRTVILGNQQYQGDVHGITNRWIFVQNGLTFQPIEGSGQYTVNNTTLPPSDQTTTQRVLTEVVMLDASGQTDLQTQGDKYVRDALKQIEKIGITSTPWPLGRQYDVFYFVHSTLPNGSRRRVEAQGWEYFMFGAPTTWDTAVVNVE